jgi:hypothetical protein
VGRDDLGWRDQMFCIVQILPAEAGFDVRLEQLLGTWHSVQDGCQVGSSQYFSMFGLLELYFLNWAFCSEVVKFCQFARVVFFQKFISDPELSGSGMIFFASGSC